MTISRLLAAAAALLPRPRWRRFRSSPAAHRCWLGVRSSRRPGIRGWNRLSANVIHRGKTVRPLPIGRANHHAGVEPGRPALDAGQLHRRQSGLRPAGAAARQGRGGAAWGARPASGGRVSRWRSLTSTLVGAAVADGAIKSLDDPVTTYIRDLLHHLRWSPSSASRRRNCAIAIPPPFFMEEGDRPPKSGWWRRRPHPGLHPFDRFPANPVHLDLGFQRRSQPKSEGPRRSLHSHRSRWVARNRFHSRSARASAGGPAP